MKYPWKIVITLAGFLTLIPLGWAQDEDPASQGIFSQVPKIGSHISVRLITSRGLCMVNSAQLDPCVKATIDGIKYVIAFRKVHRFGYSVTRVYTDDAKFKSPEGLYVGDEIAVDFPEEIFAAAYFEVYAKRGTRWIPVVGAFDSIRFTLDGKQIEDESVEKLWAGSPKRMRVWILGFIEMEDKK